MRDRLATESPEKRDSRLRQISIQQRERLATELITQHKHKTGAITAAVRELRLAPNHALHVTSQSYLLD